MTPEETARYDRAAAVLRLLAANRIPGSCTATAARPCSCPASYRRGTGPGDSPTFGISPPHW
jgi:hypothetical protein